MRRTTTGNSHAPLPRHTARRLDGHCRPSDRRPGLHRRSDFEHGFRDRSRVQQAARFDSPWRRRACRAEPALSRRTAGAWFGLLTGPQDAGRCLHRIQLRHADRRRDEHGGGQDLRGPLAARGVLSARRPRTLGCSARRELRQRDRSGAAERDPAHRDRKRSRYGPIPARRKVRLCAVQLHTGAGCDTAAYRVVARVPRRVPSLPILRSIKTKSGSR